jgi:hypothetical protein
MSLNTVRKIIAKSYKLLGVGGEGETLSSETMNDGLDSLNMLLALWGGRRLMTMAEIKESFNLTAAQVSYTMGVSSLALVTDFDTVKPNRIISAFIRDLSGNDRDVKIITKNEYNSHCLKTTPGVPECLYQDPGSSQQANQVMTLYIYPAPESSTTYTLFMFSEKPLTSLDSLSDDITFNDIYKTAIIPNLAMLLAPEVDRPVSAEVIKWAKDSMDVIETINSVQKKEIIPINPLATGSGNILNGGY